MATSNERDERRTEAEADLNFLKFLLAYHTVWCWRGSCFIWPRTQKFKINLVPRFAQRDRNSGSLLFQPLMISGNRPKPPLKQVYPTIIFLGALPTRSSRSTHRWEILPSTNLRRWIIWTVWWKRLWESLGRVSPYLFLQKKHGEWLMVLLLLFAVHTTSRGCWHPRGSVNCKCSRFRSQNLWWISDHCTDRGPRQRFKSLGKRCRWIQTWKVVGSKWGVEKLHSSWRDRLSDGAKSLH